MIYMPIYTVTILATILVQVFATVHTVAIQNFKFVPQEVDIMHGDQVTWINNDSTDHTVTSDDGASFSSSVLAKGQSFSHTFTTAATVPYHCSLHPFMLGTVKAS
jgi:plastocyanin